MSRLLFVSICATVAVVFTATAAHSQEAKPVVIANVTVAEVPSGRRVVGTVNPRRSSTIGSAIDGRVQGLLVDQGDRVQQGDVLSRLRTQTLEIERSAAKAELDLAVHQLAELENGALPEEIAQAEANMRTAKAALKNAEGDLKRIETLSSRAAASVAELGDAQEQADVAKFALAASEALLKRIKDGARIESIQQAKAQVALQQERLKLIEDRITKSTITAPFDGYISAEFTEVGAWISQGDPIVEIIQLDEVEIQAPVTAESVVHLRIGDVIRVEFPELPNELITGTIDRIVPIATSRSRTFPVIIKLENSIRDGTPMLMAGMLARVEIPAGTREALPLVPKDSLVLNGNDRSVFLVDRKSDDEVIARKVRVDLGVAVDDRIQVRGDIDADDQVVVAGNERLLPGASVKILRNVDGQSTEDNR